MRAALGRHESAIRAAVAHHGGRVFKTMGDGLYAVFATPEGAVAAACEAQLRLARMNFDAIDGLPVRMAVHAGEVEPAGEDFVGAALNRAARLIAIAHGGQILVSGLAAASLEAARLPAEAGLKALGLCRLKDLTEPEAVHQLLHPELPANFPALRALDAIPNNLPQCPTACIGREAELARLAEIVAERRIVTLHGPGGIGKTRLALQLAADLLGRFPDGTWFVELAPLTEAEQIAETIAAVLGIRFAGDRPASEALPAVLRSRRMLLILDNCEHLAEPTAALAERLLRAAGDLTILATSRARLGIGGEQCVPVGSLGLPAATADAATVLEAPAIRLFVDRARLVRPDFRLEDAAFAAVVALCHRLDGVALAIELAAARLRLLTPQELLVRLDDRFALLGEAAGAAPPRQKTLRGLLDWSHDLLGPAEQSALARLSLFGGSFGIEAAAAVIGLDANAAIGVLAALVDHSMVSEAPGDPAETRLRLLETTRCYALEKLAEDPERDKARYRLVFWLIRHYGEAARSWPTAPTATWTARYRPDIDNLRAALAWAFGPEGDGETGLELLAATSELWRNLGLTVEHRRWLREAETRISAATPPRVTARIGLDAAFAQGGGAFGDKRKVDAALDALSLYRAHGDAAEIATAAARVAVCLGGPGKTSAAQPYLDLIEATLPKIGRTKLRAWLLNIAAVLMLFRDAPRRAITLLEESLAISRAYEDPVGMQIAGLNLAETLFAEGDARRAIAEVRGVAASCRASGNLVDLGFALGNLASYATIAEDFPTARAALTEALPLLDGLGIEFVLVSAIQAAGLLATYDGRIDKAARLAGFVRRFYRLNAIEPQAAEQAVWDALAARLAAAGAEPEEDETWTLAQAVEAARSTLS